MIKNLEIKRLSVIFGIRFYHAGQNFHRRSQAPMKHHQLLQGDHQRSSHYYLAEQERSQESRSVTVRRESSF
jgi:hypothetical protein